MFQVRFRRCSERKNPLADRGMSATLPCKGEQCGGEMHPKLESEILAFVLCDLGGRKGIGNELEACDEEVRQELKDTLRKGIAKVIRKHVDAYGKEHL